MAKDLKNLIRLNKWEVDEKRRKLGELLRLLDNLEAQERALEEEVAREQSAANEAPNAAGFLYGNYAQTVIERRDRIRQSIDRMEKAIAEAREEVRRAFVELKKYEVAQENRNKREAAEEAQREQNFLNEVGLQGYRQSQLAP